MRQLHAPSLTWSAAALGLAALTSLSLGCVVEEEQVEEIIQSERRAQPVVVIPTFTISGFRDLPEALYISKLGFTVSEIRLEPLAGSTGLAYSAIQAEHVEFDVSQNVDTRQGQAISLPKTGRYLVSLRLEPVEYEDPERGTALLSSFVMSGFVNEDSSDYQLMALNPGDASEEPSPDPFDGPGTSGDDDDSRPDGPTPPDSSGAWTPFVYHNERAVFMTLNEVEFGEGEQHLTFNFNLDRWAVQIADPIVRAVRNISVPGSKEGVDISRHLDSSGQGSEAFIRRGTAAIMPR